jgi:ABC-type dipeptide/oligopeptide/nickel transport system permease subunit
MVFSATIIAIAASLSVGAAIAFVMLVIGIRQGDRARHLSDTPDTALDALTRSFLGVGVRRNDHEDD